LFAPGLPDLKAVRTVCASLSKPVSFMVGIPGRSFSVAELQEAGVRRISLATSLHGAAMSGLYRAALEVREKGTFEFLNGLVSSKVLGQFLR
jgi:2-methylisocitrate lyase-like PEP mutase family enzyme